MAWNALLVASFAAFAAALLPPCLPGLGPEFCPSTIPHDTYKASHEPIRYPDLTQRASLDEPYDDVIRRLNKTRMEADLRALTDPQEFPNRYCESGIFGQNAHKHVVDAVEKIMISGLDKDNDEAAPEAVRSANFTMPNDTPQLSYVLRILAPGSDPSDPTQSAHDTLVDTIVVGAHMDSINHQDGYNNSDKMTAPGADDNGTSVVVLMEVLRALIPLFKDEPVKNEVQFHWYAAEEVGLFGSQSIFDFYMEHSWPVKAMLNLDMVGYSGGHEADSPMIAVQTDEFVDKDLTAFVRDVIHGYSKAKPGDAACNYACSDHASAHRAGFPSAMIGESSYLKGEDGRPNGNPSIHSANDTMDHIDFDYMLEFAKVAASFISLLAYTDFSENL